jgi:hypothetical protein
MRRRPHQPYLPQTPRLIPRTRQIALVLLLRSSRILRLLVVRQQQRPLFCCGQVREASLVGGAELGEVELQGGGLFEGARGEGEGQVRHCVSDGGRLRRWGWRWSGSGGGGILVPSVGRSFCLGRDVVRLRVDFRGV